MIAKGMLDKAHSLIAADAKAAYLAANTLKNGKRRKRHVPYTLPERAAELVAALGTGDAELVAGLMLYGYWPKKASV